MQIGESEMIFGVISDSSCPLSIIERLTPSTISFIMEESEKREDIQALSNIARVSEEKVG